MSTADVYTSIRGTANAKFPDAWRHFTRGKGPSGFGGSSTAEQVATDFDGKGKVAIITGAGGGLGLETSRVLAQRGVDVIMAVRNTAAAEEEAAKLRQAQPDAKLTVMELDLSSLASVRAFAKAFLATGKPLNILLANAGTMANSFTLSKDGHELQFATNHLGHFLLVKLLLNHMIETATEQGSEGRIIVTSSVGHAAFGYPEGIRFGSLDDPKGYSAWPAYGQSKLANVLFARELAARLKGQPVAVASLHPGAILTNLGRHLEASLPTTFTSLGKSVVSPLFKRIPQGAATQVYLATAPQIVSSEYYGDVNLSPSSKYAHDAVLGRRLWEESEKLVAAFATE